MLKCKKHFFYFLRREIPLKRQHRGIIFKLEFFSHKIQKLDLAILPHFRLKENSQVLIEVFLLFEKETRTFNDFFSKRSRNLHFSLKQSTNFSVNFLNENLNYSSLRYNPKNKKKYKNLRELKYLQIARFEDETKSSAF